MTFIFSMMTLSSSGFASVSCLENCDKWGPQMTPSDFCFQTAVLPSFMFMMKPYITKVPVSQGGRHYPSEIFFGGVVRQNFRIFGGGYYPSASFFSRGYWSK